jgi:hypothetical protein
LIFIASPYRSNDSRKRTENQTNYTYIYAIRAAPTISGEKSQIKFFFFPAEVEDELIVHFGMTRFDSMARKNGKMRDQKGGGIYSITRIAE